MHSARTTIPRRGAVILALLVLGVTGLLPTALAQEEGSATAELTQDGWWNRAKGPQSGEPNNPVRPSIGGSVPAPATVPDKALGVGAAGGEPDKVAAIGILLDAPPGAIVDSLVLTLKETAENGSNINASSALIAACPITDFWAGVKNGDFVNRPTCDEGQQIPGKRGADGTWAFDLTSLATAWLDPTGELTQNGVLFREAVEPPVSFQTSFSDISTGKVTVDFVATGGSEDFDAEEFTDDAGGAVAGEPIDAGGSGGFDAGAGAAFGESPSFPETAAGSEGVSGGQSATRLPPGRPISSIGVFSNLPVPGVVLLLLVAIGAGIFLGLVLGPLGSPAVATVRSGGVSRALAEREAANGPR